MIIDLTTFKVTALMPTPEEQELGWRFSYDWLNRIKDEVDDFIDFDGYSSCIGLEEIEAVVLALQKLSRESNTK